MTEITENAESIIVSDATVAEAPSVEAPIEQEIKQEVAEAPLGLKGILSEELRDIKEFEKFKDVNELAKSYSNLNKLLGKRFSELTPDEANSFYKTLGKPESKDVYSLPEDIATDADWYKDVAFNANLTQEQARIVAEKYIEKERATIEARNKEAETIQVNAVNALKKEYGDAYEKRLELAKQAVRQFGGNDVIQALEKTGLGNDVNIIKMFAEIGKNFQEHKLIAVDKPAAFGLTPADANHKIDMLHKDQTFMKLFMKGDPKAVKEMTELYRISG